MLARRQSIRIVEVVVRDIRFPTSRTLDGSDAVNVDPDYSAAYIILRTDVPGLAGHGLTFTIGRGTEVCVAAARALAPIVAGRRLDELTADMRTFWRSLTSDSQLRWLGPEKGVIHLATAAIVNAVWDLWAKAEGKPLWQLLAELAPEELVACLDLRYVDDVLSEQDAVDILAEHAPTRAARTAELAEHGYPAYTTSAGWMGYSDARVRDLCRQGVEAGWTQFKLKVGGDLEGDLRRVSLVRDSIGPDRKLMIDANQAWGVDEAIAAMKVFAEFDPWWIEEPTSPDDVLGHARIAREIAPIGIATGEHCQNRIMFKQFMQADALQFCQIDACRLGGVNEAVTVILLAAKFGVPVCPHAGGVGLCEYVQHLAWFDYICASASLEHRVVEYVDHLHEHFVDPVRVVAGRYRTPTQPGYSIELRPESLDRFEFPDGPVWAESREQLADAR